ncbi:hypothetical protein [Nocardia sp. NPDC050406]|uniref:hypothetical protein n=1 Tax=Nocardia sp. NPDC050406 TaxID=3364318 RepID=UPI0037B4934A
MRVVVTAPDHAVTLRFEPSGMEYPLAANTQIVVEWDEPREPGAFVGSVEYLSDEIVVNYSTARMRSWNAAGERLDY